MESPSQGRTSSDRAQQGLKIFVEPIEVPNRPKLIRTLKTLGATTCEDVAEADIIVVAPETASSSELIQGWNEKVVLDVDWAYESIRRGRLYLEDENWGGFIVNAGSGASGSNATIHKSPLPTPRETPSDSQPQQEAAMQQQQAPLPEQLQFVQAGSPVPMSQYPQQQQIPQQFPGGQPVPMQGVAQNYPVMVPAAMLAQLMGLAQQQGVPSGMGMPQFPVNMIPAGQSFPSNYVQQPFPFIAQPGMFPQGGFPMAQQFPVQMVNVPHPQPMDVGSPLSGGSYHNSSSPDRQRNASYRGSPMDQDGRDTTPEHEGRHAGPSSKAVVSSSQRHRDDRQESPGELKLFTKRPGEPYLFFVQVDIRGRGRIADPIKKHGGKLVADISQADFVILGHPNTKNFEEWLRQSAFYDKLPLKTQWVLDCLEEEEILDVEGYVYEGLGRVERKRGRRSHTGQRYILTAVQSGSEDEAEEESEDEDEDEDTRPVKKKKVVERPVKQEKVKAEKKQKAKVEKKERKEGVKEEKGTKKTHSRAVHDQDTTKSSGKGKTPTKDKGKGKAPAKDVGKTPQPASKGPPSPPPPTRVVELSAGKHYYTKEDFDYCDEYLTILLARDHTMSNSTIAEKLHAKMPHHSIASWMTQLSSSRREKLAQLRRRAEIQSRKVAAQDDGHPSTSQATPLSDASFTPSMGQQFVASASAAGGSKASDSFTADPFKVMAEFFANGRADNLEDAAVWRVIAKEHPELNAQQWEEYWNTHGNRIAEEVARLTGLQSTDANGDGPKAEPE
ncbi:hypothetical protein C8T65DRAFT_12796 [Cerioporus squamosus]|nr:hypothetical protein C8T65DRAFT_12796 [Cerioporus squamosus]